MALGSSGHQRSPPSSKLNTLYLSWTTLGDHGGMVPGVGQSGFHHTVCTQLLAPFWRSPPRASRLVSTLQHSLMRAGPSTQTGGESGKVVNKSSPGVCSNYLVRFIWDFRSWCTMRTRNIPLSFFKWCVGETGPAAISLSIVNSQRSIAMILSCCYVQCNIMSFLSMIPPMFWGVFSGVSLCESYLGFRVIGLDFIYPSKEVLKKTRFHLSTCGYCEDAIRTSFSQVSHYESLFLLTCDFGGPEVYKSSHSTFFPSSLFSPTTHLSALSHIKQTICPHSVFSQIPLHLLSVERKHFTSVLSVCDFSK